MSDPNNYWMQLERLERLIRASELKSGIIFSFHSVILGFFFDRMDYLQQIFQNNIFFIILVSLWLIFVFISLFFSIKCFIPKMELKYDKNVFFFRDAVYRFGNVEEYRKKIIDVCNNQDELFKHLSEQIHVESKIIEFKFKYVKRSIIFFAISFIFVVLMFILWVIII
ncbi:MAG: Pycsar system effector family protein [Bacteroidota bacterium]